MSFLFEKVQGREAVWQGKESMAFVSSRSQFESRITPGVVTRFWAYSHLWKGGDTSHLAGLLTKRVESNERQPRTWGRTQYLDAIIFVTGSKSLPTDTQQKSSFTACPMDFSILTSQKQHTAHLLRHTHPSCVWAVTHSAFLEPSIKAKKSSRVTEKSFFIECDSLTQISLCLWISLCYHLFSRLIAAMATAHPSTQTQA